MADATDVVVLGGGLSGLTAARDLARTGRRVVLLEARDRLGGRVLGHTLATPGPGGPLVVEQGAAWLGPTQDRVLALADDLGLARLDPPRGRVRFTSRAVGRSTSPSLMLPPDPTVWSDAARLFRGLDRRARTLDVDAPWTHPRAREWDAITLGAWVRRRSVAKRAAHDLLAAWTQPCFGAEPDDLSLLFALWYVACSGTADTPGNLTRNSAVHGGAQQWRVAGGSQRLVEGVAEQARAAGVDVRLGTPVTAVAQDDAGVDVVTPAGGLRAGHLVTAAPPPALLAIDWGRALDPRRLATWRRMPMGRLMKADVVYDRPFWRASGLDGSGVRHRGAARVCFDTGPAGPADGSVPGVLVVFVGGGAHDDYARLAPDERRAAVLEGLAELFGEAARAPVEYVEKDWTLAEDAPWTGGSPVAIPDVGLMTDDAAGWSRLREPDGRVHAAGTETATYWTGYLDGAVRAGERAAREIAALSPAAPAGR